MPSFQSNNRSSLALAFTATSSLVLSYAFVSAVCRPRRKVAIHGEDIEIITKPTERNRRILASAQDLLSEPHGFDHNHFASMLAQLRPSPFRGSWGKKAIRRTENIPTPAGCDIEVEFVEPANYEVAGAAFHGRHGAVREVGDRENYSTKFYCDISNTITYSCTDST